MTEIQKQVRVGVAAVIINAKNEVLMGYRTGKHAPNRWAFAGGHMEFGETVEETAVREVLEETDLKVSPIQHDLLNKTYGSYLYKDEDKHYVTLFVPCRIVGGTLTNMEPEKCSQWKWFDVLNLPSPMMESIPDSLFNLPTIASYSFKTWADLEKFALENSDDEERKVEFEEELFTEKQFYSRYILNGPKTWSTWDRETNRFIIRIDSCNEDTLSATATVLETDYWYTVGEVISIKHVDDNMWMLLDKDNTFTQNVFLGIMYGGISIG